MHSIAPKSSLMLVRKGIVYPCAYLRGSEEQWHDRLQASWTDQPDTKLHLKLYGRTKIQNFALALHWDESQSLLRWGCSLSPNTSSVIYAALPFEGDGNSKKRVS